MATEVEIEKGVGHAADDLKQIESLRERGVDTLLLGAPDVNGEFRSKRFSLNVFCGDEVEIALSDYLFSCDIAEELMRPRSTYRGYFPTESTGLPDVLVRPDWQTLRVLPWDTRTALVLGDFLTTKGEEMMIAPRLVLRCVIEKIRALGYEPMAGTEYEFFVFRAEPMEARANPVGLRPLSEGPAYGAVRGAADEPIIGMVRRMMDDAQIPMEAAHPEAVAGQYEITLRYSDAATAADNAFLYKHFVRELLAKDDLTASFIAKYDPSTYGSSGHLHMSFRRGSLEGPSVILDVDGELSKTARHAIAGFLATLPEFTAFYAPFVNSYRRYQAEHAWAGNTVTWGFDNRSCGLRIIATTPGSARIENRVPGADINPYIALAASLAGMGYGIANELEPPEPIEGDAYARDDVENIPDDLHRAVERLDKSVIARDWLGEEFVNFYAETRWWDAEVHRKTMTDWELKRYL